MQLTRAQATAAIDKDDVAFGHGPQCLERPRDLALGVEGAAKALGKPGVQVEREICHRRASICGKPAWSGCRSGCAEP